MNSYSRRVDRLEAATDDPSSPLLLILFASESRDVALARHEAVHGPVAKRRPVIFLSETDARL